MAKNLAKRESYLQLFCGIANMPQVDECVYILKCNLLSVEIVSEIIF